MRMPAIATKDLHLHGRRESNNYRSVVVNSPLFAHYIHTGKFPISCLHFDPNMMLGVADHEHDHKVPRVVRPDICDVGYLKSLNCSHPSSPQSYWNIPTVTLKDAETYLDTTWTDEVLNSSRTSTASSSSSSSGEAFAALAKDTSALSTHQRIMVRDIYDERGQQALDAHNAQRSAQQKIWNADQKARMTSVMTQSLSSEAKKAIAKLEAESAKLRRLLSNAKAKVLAAEANAEAAGAMHALELNTVQAEMYRLVTEHTAAIEVILEQSSAETAALQAECVSLRKQLTAAHQWLFSTMSRVNFTSGQYWSDHPTFGQYWFGESDFEQFLIWVGIVLPQIDVKEVPASPDAAISDLESLMICLMYYRKGLEFECIGLIFDRTHCSRYIEMGPAFVAHR